MRFVLFYSGIESFNYFTAQIAEKLKEKGAETFILNLTQMTEDNEHSLATMEHFMQSGVDAVICYDGFGVHEPLFRQLWQNLDVVVCNILMDPPYRFPIINQEPPRNYKQFCCDRNHVIYMQKYFGDKVKNVFFMPHFGTSVQDDTCIPWESREYDILFSGTYYKPEGYMQSIEQQYAENPELLELLKLLIDYMLAHMDVGLDQALEELNVIHDFQFNKETIAKICTTTEPVDFW